MESPNTYHGWKNYETWRVNLECFDGVTAEDMGIHEMDRYDAGMVLADYVQETVLSQAEEGSLAQSYARAFLESVDWYEIAEHMIDEHVREHEEA
jgi:hypothetical protein